MMGKSDAYSTTRTYNTHVLRDRRGSTGGGEVEGPREVGVPATVSYIMRGPESNVDVDEPGPGTRRGTGQNRDP